MNPSDTTLPGRVSPLHDELAHLSPRWGDFRGMPVALSIPTPAGGPSAAERAQTLGLVDASALRRITLKGPNALALLQELGVEVSDEILGVRLQQDGSTAARTGGTEFFIEDGLTAGPVDRIAEAAGTLGGRRPGVYPVLRADASILVTGKLAPEVFAQTCGVDLRAATPDKLVFTRVAGVSCSIMARQWQSLRGFQLWTDGSYGVSLWETLAQIAAELGGGPVGWSVLFPAAAPVTSL